MSQLLKKKKSGLPKDEVFLALKEPTENGCGCGLDCDLGALILPSYNSVTGAIIEHRAVYIVDGAIVNQPYATAKTAICALKAL